MLKKVAAMTLGAVLTLAAGTFAAVPQEIGYQGYLTDAGGVPVNGSVTITFSLYTTSTGGTALWSENQTISTDKGIYSVSLGAVTPLNLPFDTRYYLGIKVGNDAELSPRQPLASTPYAYRAKWVDSHSHSATDITSGVLPSAGLGGFYSQVVALTNESNFFNGNGAGLTGLNATNLTSGTIPSARLSGTYSQALSLTNVGNSFSGNGAGVTSINASNLTSGTIPDARLPVNLQKKYSKVAVVAQSGGDYTNPVTAMGAIATWCGTPSMANPCLLKIMPGVYSIGTTTVNVQPYVDIEGSGENVTVITGTVTTASIPPTGVVNSTDNAEIRALTVKNTGVGTYVVALANMNSSPNLTNITVSTSGGTNRYGVYNVNSFATMSNVTATASGGTNSYGIYNYESSPNLSNVNAFAKDGTNNYGVYIDYNSLTNMSAVTATASGGTNCYGIYIYQSSPNLRNVNAIAKNGTNNYGVYSDYYSSTNMGDVTATASDGSNNYGVYNGYGFTQMNNVIATATATAPNTVSYGVYNNRTYPTMNNVTATATGTVYVYGVYNKDHSSPFMNNVTATARFGTNSYGVYNKDSAPTMRNVVATAASATSNIGMVNSITPGSIETFTLSIDSSSFVGSNYSISNSSAYTLKIGSSKLSGGAVNVVGTYKCVGVYDDDTYTTLNSSCQ